MSIHLRHAAACYQAPNGEVEAVRDVSFDVAQGEFVSLVGPSGCGKSTLLSAIAGLEPLTGGTVNVAGQPVTGPSRRVGFMPQRDQLFEWKNIWDNVTLGLAVQRERGSAAYDHVRELLDRYGDVLVSEVLSLGIERRRAMLYALLREELAALGVNVSCIYERNESLIREKEGMTCGKGPYAAPGLETNPSGHAEICENGIYFDVDYINGQKTGYFLDQKYNRAAAGRLAHGRRVLDCFTHTGAFALHCAAGGAESVTAVDVSASALEQARRNAERNGLEGRMEFRQADVFELLTELGKSGEKPWDYIILDPPAFTKSGATVENARRGYREINFEALRLLPRGGYLATCSCSHFMTRDLLAKAIAEAAHQANVQLKQVEERQQAPDHPILWGFPESHYLDFFVFQVV